LRGDGELFLDDEDRENKSKALCHRGAGVCQYPGQQAAGPLTLRGRQKVDTQWKLFCLLHNIEKLAHHGYAQ
jgi:hypothetical protein